MNPCLVLKEIVGEVPKIGNKEGICRIIGEKLIGVNFKDWVKDTFTDHGNLYPGEIISNEALFCFDEASTLIQSLTNKSVPQRFRNYSHIISEGKWHLFTKADKKAMFEIITEKQCDIVCIAESGQKHIFFKNLQGLWQLEEEFIYPDINRFKTLHSLLQELYQLGFTQAEIITGVYSQTKIFKIGFDKWHHLEKKIEKERGTLFFNFAAFFMFKIENND